MKLFALVCAVTTVVCTAAAAQSLDDQHHRHGPWRPQATVSTSLLVVNHLGGSTMATVEPSSEISWRLRQIHYEAAPSP